MSTALRSYWRGADLLTMRDEVAGVNRHYHFDHQGTTQALTGDNGAVTDRFSTDAWGVQVKRIGSSINRHWYIGQFGYDQAPSRPTCARSRWIACGLARWLGKHPMPGLPSSLEQDDYPYAGNRASSLLQNILDNGAGAHRSPLKEAGPASWQYPRARRRYWLSYSAPPPPAPTGPQLLSQCGGAGWIVDWILRDANNRPPEASPESVCGFIIQKVVVRSSDVFQCNPDRPLSEDQTCLPQALIYYEAWPFRHQPESRIIWRNLRNDFFRYAGIPPQFPSSRGYWEICGEAIFLEVPCPAVVGTPRPEEFRPPGHGWRYGVGACLLGPCQNWMTTNWCTSVAPPGFAADHWKVRRKLAIKWNCGCSGGCVCEKCGGYAQVGDRRPTNYICQPRGSCLDESPVGSCRG
jgi:hypothetical protein